ILTGALAAARRRHRRGDDVLQSEVGAHAAVIAGRPSAIGEPVLGEGRLPVVPEEVLVEAGVDVVPGQDLVGAAVTGDVPLRVDALRRARLEPAVEVEALGPLLERAARAPYALDHAPD